MVGNDRLTYTGCFEDFLVASSGEKMIRSVYLFLSGDNEKTASWEKGLIHQACRKLVEYGCYSTILNFASYVLSHQKTYNKKVFLETMKDVGLDTFCVQYYNFHVSEWKRIDQYVDERFEDLRRFVRNDGPMDESIMFSSPWLSCRTASIFTAKQLYGLDIDVDQVTEEDIEKLIKSIEKEAMTKYKNDLNEAIQRNREKAACEKKLGQIGTEYHFGREVCTLPSEYKLKKKTIGILIEWMKLLFNGEKRALAIKILANHILDLLGDTIIDDKEVAGIFLNIITEYLRISDPVGNNSAPLFDTIKDVISRKTVPRIKDQKIYFGTLEDNKKKAEELFNEYTGITREYLNAIESCPAEYGIISRSLANMLLAHKEAIRENMQKILYDFLTFFTLVMLQVNGDNALTDHFLVEMIDDISSEDRQRVIFQIILVTRILNSNSPKIINILNGYFNYEMDRPKRDLLEVKTIYVNMIRFIKDARNEIECRNEYTNRFSKSWLEVFFGDGIIDGFISEQESLIKNDQIEKVDGKRLTNYVYAFSRRGYIYVDYLRQMGHKISMEYEEDSDFGLAISEQLYKKGEYYLEQYSKLRSFNLANILQRLHDNVNVVVQRRLYQLIKQAAEESLKQIQTIKRRATDDNEQEILEFIDGIVQDLTEQIMVSSSGMSYIENHLDEAQEVFVQKHRLPLTGGTLIDKLPLECRNKVREYLKTSQYVFDLLSTREFSEEVDYSAAIIPLTKALECIFHQVYSQIKDGTSLSKEDLDVDFHKAFWVNTNERTNLELGSALYLIKGFKKYRIISGEIRGEDPYDIDFFTKYNVNRYLKMDRLKSFAGTEIPVLAFNSSKNRPPLLAQFTTDDVHNRTVLYTALDYIRDEFRNKCAHKDPMGKKKAEECRNILIEAQQLLWVLMWLYESASD